MAIEIFDDLSTATLNTDFGSGYNGWTLYRAHLMGVIEVGGERVLAAKEDTPSADSKSILKTLISAGEVGRLEAKVKITNKTPGSGRYFRITLNTVSTYSGNGATRRSIWMDSVTGDIALYINNGSIPIVTNANIPVNEWLTIGIAYDANEGYTGYVLNQSGTFLGTASGKVAGDIGIALWAHIGFGFFQSGYDAQGWGNQIYMKDIIARNDLLAFSVVGQRHKMRMTTRINGEDAFVTVPSNWGLASKRAVIAGHGFGGTGAFEQYNGSSFVTDGFLYASSNTHGDTWGNAQSNSDIETLRQWLVSKAGCDQKVILNGGSMGAITAFNYATQYPTNVDRIIAESPTANLLQRWNNGRATALQSTFSVTRFEEIPSQYDPIRNIDVLKDIPIVIWAGNQDPTVPHSSNGKLLADKLARAGGVVLYFEEQGEGHLTDYDYVRNKDFVDATVSNRDPNGLVNLIDQTSTSKTQLVRLTPDAQYKIQTTSSNIAVYSMNGEDGTLTSLTATETIIQTPNKPVTLLIKITDGTKQMTDISIYRER